MLREMFVIAKERKSIEDRRGVVTRQIAELNQLMTDVKGDRFSSPRASKRWTAQLNGIHFVFNKKRIQETNQHIAFIIIALLFILLFFFYLHNFLTDWGFLFRTFEKKSIHSVSLSLESKSFSFDILLFVMNIKQKIDYKNVPLESNFSQS